MLCRLHSGIIIRGAQPQLPQLQPTTPAFHFKLSGSATQSPRRASEGGTSTAPQNMQQGRRGEGTLCCGYFGNWPHVLINTQVLFAANLWLTTNNSYILAAGRYHSLASTFEYLNHIYQKKSEKCCLLCTLYCLEISVPSKEQKTILKVARQQFFIIHGEFSPTS